MEMGPPGLHSQGIKPRLGGSTEFIQHSTWANIHLLKSTTILHTAKRFSFICLQYAKK